MRTHDPESTPTARRALALAAAACVLALAAVMPLSAPASAAGSPPWFGSNVRVNMPPAFSGTMPSIAVGSDGVVYLAFQGNGGTATAQDIFFTKSTDHGRSWTKAVKVNGDNSAAGQTDPSLALDRLNNIYIAWTDNRPTTGSPPDIYFSKSTDGGLSFSANVLVNAGAPAQSQSEPSIAVDVAGIVYVAWTDTRNQFTTGPDIYFANSTDGGLSFGVSVRVNNDAGANEQGRSTIAVAPDRTVYAAWEDMRNNALRGRDIYFAKSRDLGNVWDPNFAVNDDPAAATQAEPTMAVNGTGTIFLAWTDYRAANTAPDIYEARSSNGLVFTANVKVNEDDGNAIQAQPSIAAGRGGAFATWTDGRTLGGSGFDIVWSTSPDGLTWSPSQRVNDDTGTASQFNPTVAIDGSGDAFAAWLDTRSTGSDVYAATLDVVAPIADAGPDLTVGQGAYAQFDGSGSVDNLGLALHSWDFGDGTTATGVVVSHAYSKPGGYTATLTVRDWSGNADSDTVLVVVQDTEAPVIHGAGDRMVDEGAPLFFDAGASTDNVGVASWSWNFGDNNAATGPTATHVFARPGTYNVTLTVSDAAGNAATATMSVTVRTVAPKSSELLGMIQVLDLFVVIIGILLAVVGFMAYTFWRRSRGGPRATYPTPSNPTRAPDPLDMPPPPSEPRREP